MLLEEYDAERRAVINSEDIYGHPKKGFPKTVVSVFSYVLFNEVLKTLGGKVIFKSHDADGEWPVYEVGYGGRRFAFAKARVGAPACVGDLVALRRRCRNNGSRETYIGSTLVYGYNRRDTYKRGIARAVFGSDNYDEKRLYRSL